MLSGRRRLSANAPLGRRGRSGSRGGMRAVLAWFGVEAAKMAKNQWFFNHKF